LIPWRRGGGGEKEKRHAELVSVRTQSEEKGEGGRGRTARTIPAGEKEEEKEGKKGESWAGDGPICRKRRRGGEIAKSSVIAGPGGNMDVNRGKGGGGRKEKEKKKTVLFQRKIRKKRPKERVSDVSGGA